MPTMYELKAKIFKAFCDENRLKILELLQSGEKCACTLQDELPIGQSTLSHHMKLLIESGVVKVRKDKKWSYYSLSDEGSQLATETLRILLTPKYNDSIQFIKEIKNMKTIKTIEIFDPAMCCSTGVCGPSIDSELMRVATLINSLKEKGLIIKRYGLSTEPHMFVSNQIINDILQADGADILPVTLVDGKVAKKKVYPSNAEFAEWLSVDIQSKSEQKQSCSCGPKGCC